MLFINALCSALFHNGEGDNLDEEAMHALLHPPEHPISTSAQPSSSMLSTPIPGPSVSQLPGPLISTPTPMTTSTPTPALSSAMPAPASLVSDTPALVPPSTPLKSKVKAPAKIKAVKIGDLTNGKCLLKKVFEATGTALEAAVPSS
ncbi:hypothetical protein BT96DRAFT_941299 [Gymnopus androsaceus JB14]|uniref:Uncharacterized protein n=1 Tax=Gymnopus androsaceus JB14 TaxID=1447944 RepID=A0A6A4HJC7_9AGAR|nr:hypothetical protein BT96DRAFT_941299 [Gymnopus androsaceus JB14]